MVKNGGDEHNSPHKIHLGPPQLLPGTLKPPKAFLICQNFVISFKHYK